MMERAAVLPLIDELMSLVRIDRQHRSHVAAIIDSIAYAVSESAPPRPQSALRVRFLGQFALRGSGDWLDGPRLRSARQLIAYLILHRRSPASRQTLTELFWPGSDADGLTHRLHLAVSSARHVLRLALDGDDPILCASGGYGWQPSVLVESDVETFLRAEHGDDERTLREAMALYRGEFLAGEDADWVQPVRVRCASAYESIIERLGRAAYDAGRFNESLAIGLELVALDLGYEGATRLVMRSFAALGRPFQAEREYGKLNRFLKRRLNAEPTAETRLLLQDILSGSRASAATLTQNA
jgi:DNA-binding SARP family transcriptional activator